MTLEGQRGGEPAGVSEIRYGDTAALVAEPEHPTGAGVVVAHGGREPGKHIFVPDLVALAEAGFVALAPDTRIPFTGDADADAQALEAAVLNQRRALDALESGYGVTRFGFFGHSFGADHGAILSATEPRLDAIVLAALATGVIRESVRARGLGQRYLEAVERFDPVHYVVVPGRRHLLFQAGRSDDVMPLAAARALYDAAAGPKTWREYDCGHGVDGHLPARDDRIAFFREVLAT